MTGIGDDTVVRAVEGDEEAMTVLLREFGPHVATHIRSSIGAQWRSLLDEHDIMQVTYLEAFLRIDRLNTRTPRGFAAWLRRIAENNLRDAIRMLDAEKRPSPTRQVRPTGTPSQDSMVGLVNMLGATSKTPSRAVAANEAKSFLDQALADLPLDYRQVVQMYDLEGRSAKDVAERMERSEGAIYMLRARAHDALQELMGARSRFFSRGE